MSMRVSAEGTALVYPLEAAQLRKGGYALLKGFPCKVWWTSLAPPL